MDYWVMCVCIYVNQCDAIKHNSHTQIWALQLTSVSKWQHCSKTKDSPERVRVKWKWGPYIFKGKASIGCYPSPPNPWMLRVHWVHAIDIASAHEQSLALSTTHFVGNCWRAIILGNRLLLPCQLSRQLFISSQHTKAIALKQVSSKSIVPSTPTIVKHLTLDILPKVISFPPPPTPWSDVSGSSITLSS